VLFLLHELLSLVTAICTIHACNICVCVCMPRNLYLTLAQHEMQNITEQHPDGAFVRTSDDKAPLLVSDAVSDAVQKFNHSRFDDSAS